MSGKRVPSDRKPPERSKRTPEMEEAAAAAKSGA